MIALWMHGLLAGRSGRLLGAIAGVALTVALIVVIGTFTVSASRSMTAHAITGLPVDWQLALLPGTSPASVREALAQAAPTEAVATVGYADIAGFKATTGQTEQTTGLGKVLGLPPGYRSAFPGQITNLLGTWDGVLIAQQTAANLHVGVGDTVTIERIGLDPVTVTIAGVVTLPNADSMFQAVGSPPGVGLQAPPDNVLLMPESQWHAAFAQASARPDTVQLQLHVRLAHNRLPPNPGAAFLQVTRAANNLAARTSGSVLIGNNLAARLAGARSDALYARVLFLFLGVPGVVLAALFTLSVAASGEARRRREQGLLRTRGASIAQVLQAAGAEAGAIGVGGMVAGLILAVVATFAWWQLGALGSAAAWIGVGAFIGLLLALCGILLPAWRDVRASTVAASRATYTRGLAPLWQRLFLDIALLGLAALVFWVIASTGYEVVVAPEGVPQTAVHYDAFLAPLCLWIGAALLVMRLTRLVLARGQRMIAHLLRSFAGTLSPVIAASLCRQRDLIARGAVLVVLAFAFATSTSVFDTTYKAQSRVDAELTNGADVTVTGTTAAPAGAMLHQLAALPGVKAAQPMMHRFAYVGSDLQDIYGIDPRTIGQATSMSNAFFAGASARATLARLAATRDGVLVSEETVRDFQLQLGDRLNLRLQNAADHKYHVVPFRYVGIAREFPTAPKDSFLVANAAYIAQATGTAASEVVLLRTGGDPAHVAAAARRLAGATPGIKVTTLEQVHQIIGSSLTAVDLSGLTGVELGFAVLMIAGSTGLVLALGLAGRRRSFAILTALGARAWQLGAFVWSEVSLILIIGAGFGIAIGFGVAAVLVKLLSGVFDPPPQSLSIPWPNLVIAVAAAAICTGAAAGFMLSLARRINTTALRQG
jgi:putative ABC transport system permease protein